MSWLRADYGPLGWWAGDRIHLGGDPTPYVVIGITNNTLRIAPVWWWALIQAVLSVFD